jgi:peptidoglycan/xylan/chitin deacetylase (PgdA/CDA1 family)
LGRVRRFALRRPLGWGAVALLLAVAVVAGCGGGSGSTRTTTTPAAAKRKVHKPTTTTVAARTVPVLIPPANAPQRSVRVPVLTYHRVHTMPAVGQLDLIVDPTVFDAELKALHDGGYHPIHQAQLFDAIYKGARLPPKPIIISVDDGYVDDVRTILPDLERWHMVATFFVITGRTHEPGFVTADQIRELDRAGMDVGDHTAHHLDLPELTPSELKSETAGSRRALQSILGHPVYYFAYPFGAFNDAVLQAVHAAGFTMAYTTQSGTTESTGAPLTMPRLHIGRDETPSGLLALLGSA